MSWSNSLETFTKSKICSYQENVFLILSLNISPEFNWCKCKDANDITQFDEIDKKNCCQKLSQIFKFTLKWP